MSSLHRTVFLGCLLSVTFSVGFSQSTQQKIEEHSRAAQTYLHENKPLLAIPELQAIVALDPNNADAQGNLGVLLFFQGSFAKAVPHLHAAVSLHPELSKIQGLLGIAEKRIGNTDDATKDLEAVFPAVQEAKFKVQVGMELIEVYTSTGNLEKAASVIGALRQADPTNKEILYVAYRIYADLAGDAMLTLSLVAPDSAQMHQVMAHELARQGNTAAAIEQYKKAMSIDPKLPEVHYELAELLNDAQDTRIKETAEPEYLAAIKDNPFDEKSLSRMGDIYMRKGDIQKAHDAYQSAVQLQPDDPDAAFGLAKTLVAMDQPDKALPVMEKAVQLDPTNASAHFRLSTLYRQVGRIDDSKHQVDEYKKYTEMKDKLSGVFKVMHVQPDSRHTDEQDDAGPQAKK